MQRSNQAKIWQFQDIGEKRIQAFAKNELTFKNNRSKVK